MPRGFVRSLKRNARRRGGNLKLASGARITRLAEEARDTSCASFTFNSDHAEARKALGYQRSPAVADERGIHTDSKPTKAPPRSGQGRWTPRIEAIRAGLAQANERKRQAAEKDLLAIKDGRRRPGR